MNAMIHAQPIHDARFTWDDGLGESNCSSLYLETRMFQRVAAGKAAEARLQRQYQIAAEYDTKARNLSLRLDALRKAGHIGRLNEFRGGEFRNAFATATVASLAIV
jgi:hypothetical protein